MKRNKNDLYSYIHVNNFDEVKNIYLTYNGNKIFVRGQNGKEITNEEIVTELQNLPELFITGLISGTQYFGTVYNLEWFKNNFISNGYKIEQISEIIKGAI